MSNQAEAILGERYRRLGLLSRGVLFVSTTAAVTTAIIYIFNIIVFGRCMVATGYLYLLQALLLPLVFFLFPASPSLKDSFPWYDILFACLCFVIPFSFFLKAYEIIFEGWEIGAPTWAYVMALIYWPLILEACRRTVGLFFSIFLLILSVYPLFASIAPGIFEASNTSLYRAACYHILSNESVNGFIMGVMGKLFIGFFLFGTILVGTGAGEAFLHFATAILGNVRGASAKVSILSSALVASITGGPIENVIIVGSFTIPAMKRSGYSPHYAAAIETCASTGGVLMPPVMGAVAFIMAALLDIRYVDVCLAAIVPIFIYYVSLFVQVDGQAVKAGIKALPKSEIPALGTAIRDISPYFIAIIILVWLLVYLRREAQAPFYAAAYLLAIPMLRKKTRLGFRGFINLIENTGRLLAELLPVLLGIGFVLGSLFITGAAQSVTSAIVDLARGNVYLLILFSGIASFILGMGLTVSACYLLLAILVAPALIKFGLDTVAVHLFLVYCGMLSYITPPVALAAFAAAALAGAPSMKVGWQAVRLGAVIFILPFFFVLNPAFVLRGSPWEIIEAVGIGFVGAMVLSSSVEGYLVGIGRLAPLPRFITLASGMMLLLPTWTFRIIGAGLIVGVSLTVMGLRRRAPANQEGV